MVCPLRFGVFGLSALIAACAVLFTWVSTHYVVDQEEQTPKPSAKRKQQEQTSASLLLDMFTGKYLADCILNFSQRSSHSD
ncbi:hypothetical protein WJX73_000662 [Symbiochloris irregularis]|uniref:Uncharacterized protein n=1 Tax=Symbiochloris irregularis TaxID=706552 RepID=A0AAW1PB90_9CHLO